jgi:hypothetical protein
MNRRRTCHTALPELVLCCVDGSCEEDDGEFFMVRHFSYIWMGGIDLDKDRRLGRPRAPFLASGAAVMCD